MTVYAGKLDRFRPGPSPAALALTGAGFAVLGAALASLSSALLDSALAWIAGWPGPLAVYAPLVARSQGAIFSTPPLSDSYALAPLAVPALCGVLALALMFLWPTAQLLANRLFIHQVALMLAVFGMAAPLLDPSLLAELQELTNAAPIYASALFCSAAGFIVLIAERRTLKLMANVNPDPDLGERVNAWILRVPVGLALVGILAIANHYFAALWALGGALLLSLAASLAPPPMPHYERAAKPEMKRAAVAVPLMAAAAAAAFLFTFGVHAAGIRPRAIVISLTEGIGLEPLRLVAPSTRIRSPYATPAPAPSPTPEEKKIDVRWSR